MDHEANDFSFTKSTGEKRSCGIPKYDRTNGGKYIRVVSSRRLLTVLWNLLLSGLLWADVSRQFHEFVMPVITSCGVESKSWCLHGFWLCKTNFCLWYILWTYSKKPKLLENYHNQLILVILRAIAPSQVSPILSAALEWSILKQCTEQNTVFAEIKEN